MVTLQRLSYIVLRPGMDVYDAGEHLLGSATALRQPDGDGRYHDQQHFYRFVPAGDPLAPEPGFLIVRCGLLHRRRVIVPLRAIARVEPGRVTLSLSWDELSADGREPTDGRHADPQPFSTPVVRFLK